MDQDTQSRTESSMNLGYQGFGTSSVCEEQMGAQTLKEKGINQIGVPQDKKQDREKQLEDMARYFESQNEAVESQHISANSSSKNLLDNL